MSIDVLMPALSPTMEEGTLAKWHVKKGDTVKSGDVIAEIETDKATMEVEAVDEGTLAKIVVPEGTEGVKVNTPIAILAVEGEDIDKAGEGIGEEEAKPAKSAEAEKAAEAPAEDAGGQAKEAAEEPSVQKEAAKARMISWKEELKKNPNAPPPGPAGGLDTLQ